MDFNLILLQANDPMSSAYMDIASYGILGIFAVIMVFAIKKLVEYINSQNDKMVQTYIEQVKTLVNEKKEITTEKEELNDSFLKHLKDNEGKFLDIISENSKAFNAVADSNENVADAVSLLVQSINSRSNKTDTLNNSIIELINKKDK